jgi:NADPH:quinone reductase-like Zn-dependent oxidoreductase
MSRLRVHEKATGIDDLVLAIEAMPEPRPEPGQVVVEVRAAGVNPSDVKATLGMMPHAVWPRTPGRDWAGVVVDGPQDLLGQAVWGSAGDLGISRDGSHARYLVVGRDYVRPKPANLSFAEAGSLGVPFVTACEGFRRAGWPKPGETVLVLGANGKVGQAACQIATMAGARVIGVNRSGDRGACKVEAMIAADGPVAEQVRELTGGRGADIVFNTVGSPYFAEANKAMALRALAIFIATIERSVPFDILPFYRGQHSYVGIDTLAFDGAATAAILDDIIGGFETGALTPYPVVEAAHYPMTDAIAAYRAVLGGATDRVVLIP